MPAPRVPVRALAALFLAALALRPQLVGLGPLLPQVQGELGVSHGLAGLLTTVPVLCMAALALPAVRIAHRIGLKAAMTVAIVAIAVFGALRPLFPAYPVVLLTTVGIGVGIGLGGALLPRAVRLLAPERAGLATGIYSGGIQTGATLAAASAAPLALLGDWRLALIVFAAGAAIVLVGWLVAAPVAHGASPDDAWPSYPWSSLPAWRMVGIFALNSLCFYGLITWLPTAFVEMGWPETDAGRLVALLNLAGLPACFLIPAISDRSLSRHRYVFAGGLATLVAIIGILAVPDVAFGWVVLAGGGLGALFPLSMTLPIDVGPDDVAGHAAMMLTGGYGVAAVAPAALGWVRDETGGFALPFWILAAAALLLCALSARPLRAPAAARS
jgi:CP family cyanate transporter-like MFS transporter